MRILAGLTMFFLAMGDVVVGDDLDDNRALIKCLEAEGAVWGDCFATYRNSNEAETRATELNLTVGQFDYKSQLTKELGLSENLEGDLVSAIDIWAPNPYAAVIQSYISGAALAVGDDLLMR